MNRLHYGPWPKFLIENNMLGRSWRRMYKKCPEWQMLFRNGSEYVGVCNMAPIAWDGTVESLPEGLYPALKHVVETDEIPNSICCFSVLITDGNKGSGLSEKMLEVVKSQARAAGYENILIPVRPVLKPAYPLTDMADYAKWERHGLPFDPWMRIQAKLGGEVLGIAKSNVSIKASLCEWEQWTDMTFPQSGEYVIPNGHTTLKIDYEKRTGTYHEQGVWMKHTVSS